MTTNQQDFYQLNLAYLHAARELARIDPQEAVLRFGLTAYSHDFDHRFSSALIT